MKPFYRNTTFSLIIGSALLLSACTRDANEGTGQDSALVDTTAQPASNATAQVKGLQDSTITGNLTFAVDGMQNLSVTGTISGLAPGAHGFHIHDGSSCDAPGTHLNPTNMPHAAPDSANHHVGDLGNIDAGADGTAQVNVTVTGFATLDQINNKPVVIHTGQDDLTTQPSGNSGTPIACGMIMMEGGAMDGMMGAPMMPDDSAHAGGN